MATILNGSGSAGLERSCGGGGYMRTPGWGHDHADLANYSSRQSDWVRARGPVHGVELLQAWFGAGGYDRHRHDTYGICLTDVGVQSFDYRGSGQIGLPGQVTVLHPDEMHDGRAGDAGGFGYRIVYVEPARIAEAVWAVRGRPGPLPFVREPVSDNPVLARAIREAFGLPLEPLAIDALVLRLAEGLLDAAHTSAQTAPHLDQPALARCRAFLDSSRAIVRSSELEAITGLSRYELARQFRALYGTSPYRYSLLRRLDFARSALNSHPPLADLALRAGFADQAHFTRMFRSAYGLTPARYARLRARSGGRVRASEQ